jgi:hypothetical protein
MEGQKIENLKPDKLPPQALDTPPQQAWEREYLQEMLKEETFPEDKNLAPDPFLFPKEKTPKEKKTNEQSKS